MKRHTVEANKMNHMDMENMKNMMEMSNLMQKVGKSNRKYDITLNYAARQILASTLSEMKNMISKEGAVPKNLSEFVDYIKESKKKKTFKLSFDEIEFLKRFTKLTIDQYSQIKVPWYKFITKILGKLSLMQFKEILNSLKI
jgi:hypothetical protein